ncbi:MAG TPA: enoyl-CoA hydratase/isomerase family protein [Bryobacteraceae bacterium]|nr:enoyl-CoA hydratase/isomerase family protein [Bryobacteraceae bacterium]
MIDYRVTGAVARVMLSRPEKRNALDDAAIAGLLDSLGRAYNDAAVRVLLITGAGQDFCSGMDIGMLEKTANAGVMDLIAQAENLAAVYRAMRRYPKPVVSAVRGRALGGGCGLALACDAVLAAESAQFGFPEVKIGFVPAIVMSLLRRSVGEKRAFDLLASGEPVRAREALDLGMITRVYADSEFDAGVEAHVASLAEKSASALALTKKLLYIIDGMGFDAAIDAGVQANAIARMTEDARRGFERFSKK